MNTTSSHSYTWTRLWIKISSIFGIIITILLSGVYFYYLANGNKGLNPDQAQMYNSIMVQSINDLFTVKVILFILMIFSPITTLICNWGLIRYANSPDNEFVANKWTLACLSLSIGGFFAPFLLTWLPNIDTKATKNARATLVRYFGLSWGLSFVAILIAFAIYQVQANRQGVVLTNQEHTYLLVYYVVGGVLAVFNLDSFALFASHKADQTLAAKAKNYKLYYAIIWIYTVLATMLLVIQMITAILKTLEAIGEIFRNDGAIARIFAIINALFSLMTTIFMVYIITQVIKGLWQSGADGRVSMYQSNRYANYQSRKLNQ